MQVDPMQRCCLRSPTLEKIKMLAGVHGEMHVKLAHLTAQTVHGVGSEERIDLMKNSAGGILEHEPVLEHLPVQGRGREQS